MKYQNRIEPENCSGMEDIRIEIDTIDRDIIAILGKRFEYVKAAAKFKPLKHLFAHLNASRLCWNNVGLGLQLKL